jgi:integrase
MINSEIITVKGYNRAKANEVFEHLDIIDATKAEYQRRLTLFLDYVEVEELTVNTFLNYKRLLGSREDLSVSSKNKYLTAARIFMRELHRHGVMPMDITPNVRNFRQGKYHKKDGLTEQDVELVRDWCYMHSENFRDVAITSLLLYLGLRQVEITRLNWEDINLKKKVIMIRGKGRDDKEPVFLHDDVALALLRLCYAVQDKRGYSYGNDERLRGAVFRSKTYTGQYKRLTTRGLRLVIQKMFVEVGIEGKSTHGFRHYYVTKLLKAYKGDVMTVMKYTRHRSPQMLEVYNDRIIQETDLPRYFKTFDNVKLVV